MKRISMVVAAMFIAGFAFADDLDIGSFPPGQWLDANYDGVWEISPANIRLLAKSGIVLWDFSQQTINDFQVSVDEETPPSLSFSCVESHRSYQFVKEDLADENLTLNIERFGVKYSVVMEPISVTALEVDTSPTESGMTYAYKIGDTGPGGGVIYARLGRVYSEAAQLDGAYKWQDVKDAAEAYDGGGLNDWRAPTKDELNGVYKSKVIKSGNFWSATASSLVNAYDQNFATGYQGSKGAKTTQKSALAIRTFEAEDVPVSEESAAEESAEEAEAEPLAEGIGETGVGGGVVYLIDGGTYSEVRVLEGSFNWAGAKLAADSYTGGDLEVGSWRAPTDADLQAIYASKVITSGNFWSSEDTNPLNAHDIRFESGNIGTAGSKSTERSALAIHTYTVE